MDFAQSCTLIIMLVIPDSSHVQKYILSTTYIQHLRIRERVLINTLSNLSNGSLLPNVIAVQIVRKFPAICGAPLLHCFPNKLPLDQILTQLQLVHILRFTFKICVEMSLVGRSGSQTNDFKIRCFFIKSSACSVTVSNITCCCNLTFLLLV